MNFLPTISENEQTAIEAGSVWLEGELFSGSPDLRTLHQAAYPDLTPEEQAFLEGPVEKVCGMVDNWDVHVEKRLPEEVWDYLKEERFFGLIIPKRYGGRGFSPSANSAVVSKLASRSSPLAITVMVPNSLGPGELLAHYGTDEQQEHYLPRLVTGEEIPAFALTEPYAGSDAGSMRSRGEVFRGDDGDLYLRLNWEKRYITLAPIASILGLAFKLDDPENLLGQGTDLGITCALVPTDTDGVVVDQRHDPLGVPFYNAPTEGHDVVVPIDAIIGGAEQAGNGWRMLMETLAAGRGISLPASAIGASKKTLRTTSAYTRIREQFGIPIGLFEGIEEPLARIAGFTYMMEAGRRYTNGGLDQGAKPAVVSAIVKYQFTELGRDVVNDGMDILGGAGISRGPRNILAHDYEGIPISITVEGANILTRTLMVFGQGAIRCHPYIYDEIQALMNDDAKAFDRSFWSHVGHAVQNGFRSMLLSVTRGHFVPTPADPPATRYYQKLAWASASFAFFSDLALVSLGGALKRKEKLSGRFADVLSWMYLATATLRRFEEEDKSEADQQLLAWSMDYAFGQIQEAFDGILRHLPVPGLGWLFSGPVRLWSRMNPIGTGPSDREGHQIAQMIQEHGGVRDALTTGMFIPTDEEDPLAHLDRTLVLVEEAAPVAKKIRSARKAGEIEKEPADTLTERALEAEIITEDEADLLSRAEEARYRAIQVDAFDLDDYYRKTPAPPAVSAKIGDRT
jgi:acyl-CoA dehydrogenase